MNYRVLRGYNFENRTHHQTMGQVSPKCLILVYFYSYLCSQLNIQLINCTINTWTFGSGRIHLARECINETQSMCVCVFIRASPPRCLDRSEPNFVCHISVGPPLQMRNIYEIGLFYQKM